MLKSLKVTEMIKIVNWPHKISINRLSIGAQNTKIPTMIFPYTVHSAPCWIPNWKKSKPNLKRPGFIKQSIKFNKLYEIKGR
jgi:hypothetical protein